MTNQSQATQNQTIALFLARTLLGIIFFFQGFGKVFTWGLEGVYANAFQSYEEHFPSFLLWATAYFTSYVELIGGLLLILGLFRNWAYYALGAVLLVVSIGHGVASPIWDLQHVMYRAILLILLLLLPMSWDQWSLDRLRS